MTTETAATWSQESAPAYSIPATATWSSNGIPLVEKRREMRYATCEPVEVYLLDVNNLHLSGVVRDISKSGMRIELDMPLKAGDRLEVLLQNTAIVFTEVRYCRRSGECYHVGMKIDDVYYPKRVPSRTSNTVLSEAAPKPVTHQIRVMGKRSSDASEQPVLAELHLNRNDVENLLQLRLSDTKASLLERHLASCDQCLDLLLLALEERAAVSATGHRAAFGSSR